MKDQLYINTNDPLAVDVVKAIHTGDIPTLKRLLADSPGLAQARLGDNALTLCTDEDMLAPAYRTPPVRGQDRVHLSDIST